MFLFFPSLWLGVVLMLGPSVCFVAIVGGKAMLPAPKSLLAAFQIFQSFQLPTTLRYTSRLDSNRFEPAFAAWIGWWWWMVVVRNSFNQGFACPKALRVRASAWWCYRSLLSATTMVTPVIHCFFQHAIEQNQEKHQCVLTSVERKSHFMPIPSSKETSRLWTSAWSLHVTATCKISALHVRHVLRQCTAHVLPIVVAKPVFYGVLRSKTELQLNILVASISICLRTFRKRIWEGSHRVIYSIRCDSWVLCRLLLYRWCLVCLFLPQHALRLCLSFSQPICCRFCCCSCYWLAVDLLLKSCWTPSRLLLL